MSTTANNFVAIDSETATSLRSSICEIGIAVVEDGEVKETKSWMVQPPGNAYDYPNILVHHIRPEDTADSPSFAEVWPEVAPYLEGQTVVAHNTSFDMYALRDALDENGLDYPTFRHICSCRLSRTLIPGCYNYRLPTVCEAIGFQMGQHHRGGSDAEAAAHVFLACLERAGVKTVEELEEKYHFTCGSFSPGAFVPQKAKSQTSGRKIVVKDIVGDPSKINEGNYFFDKEVCFTGTCSFHTRAEMLQWIADIGGIPANSITKRTQVLVVGQQDYRVVGDIGMSGKQRKAMALRDAGQDIEILSESESLQMI